MAQSRKIIPETEKEKIQRLQECLNFANALDDIQDTVRDYYGNNNIELVVQKVLPKIVKSNKLLGRDENREQLKQAIHYAFLLHLTHYRESGDRFLVHPLQAGYIVGYISRKMAKVENIGEEQREKSILSGVIKGILHDGAELNPELCDVIMEGLYWHFGEDIKISLSQMTSRHSENSLMEKYCVDKRIIQNSKKDPLKIDYLVRIGDRISNLRTIQYLHEKNGLEPEKRMLNTIQETRDMIIPMAVEIDRLYVPRFSLEVYINNLMEYAERNYLTPGSKVENSHKLIQA
jgi:(p)ppGpp synthase/HD superfamily hydrolase